MNKKCKIHSTGKPSREAFPDFRRYCSRIEKWHKLCLAKSALRFHGNKNRLEPIFTL